MRASTFSVFVQLSALAFAQDISSLPKCAQTAALSGASSSGCGLTDASCLCNNAGFIASLKSTISGSCTGSDQLTACNWGNSACASYGASIDCSVYAAAASGGDGESTTSPAAATESPTEASPTPSAGDAAASSTTSSIAGTEDAAAGTAATPSTTMSMSDSGETSGMGSTTSSMTSMASMITSAHGGNGTVSCTHSCGNHTLAATSMVSKTTSAPTSQYTGAANTAARRCGVVGILTGVALLVAFL